MKKLVPVFLTFIVTLLMVSCPIDEGEGDDPFGPVDQNQYTFWAQDTTDDSDYQITAKNLAVRTYCEVWADINAGVTEQQARDLATEFDTRIYQPITNAFGSYQSINNSNGKLLLLMLDIRDNYGVGGNTGYTAGYFYSRDLTSHAHSNRAAMLYIDTNPGLNNVSQTYATVAHELQHIINLAASVNHRRVGNTVYAMDTWIDEGLSSAAEHIYGGRQDSRITWFNRDTYGTIANGNNFYVWGEQPTAILDEYATDYLFFQWLRIHGGGIGIYKNIITSPYADYRAVTAAAASIDSNWDSLLGKWLEANYVNAPSGIKGYKGEMKTRVWAVAGSKTLKPGEGVYTISSSAPTGDTYKKFLLMNKNALSGDLYPPYNGSRVLMYNANVNQTTTITDTLSGTAETKPSPLPLLNIQGSFASAENQPYVIDARDLLGRDAGTGTINIQDLANDRR
ncbi:hypothetical protein AGMMS49579_14220 [Spirochaetia bacterium]|nr:hypothetical protein AGMMS49579_14220 [Spirochaetia bacterium]